MRAKPALIVTCVAALFFVPLIALPPSARAGLCQPGWYNKGSWDNSFTYDVGGKKVAWAGHVTLYHRYDSDCDVIDVSVTFGVGGGTVTLKKSDASTVFISFTIQYPSPFSDYNNVYLNRVGDIASLNPSPGTYSGYTVEWYDVANSDEFDIVTDDTTQHTISSVSADFRILNSCGGQTCLGKTVYAQIHAGFNLQNNV